MMLQLLRATGAVWDYRRHKHPRLTPIVSCTALVLDRYLFFTDPPVMHNSTGTYDAGVPYPDAPRLTWQSKLLQLHGAGQSSLHQL
jgi:hypothetical protein